MSNPDFNLETQCAALVTELGLGRADDVVLVEQLTGGVASDIAKVILKDRTICVKFALRKLKVEEDWFAPVHRNKAEYAWLSAAAAIAPEAALQLHGRSEARNGFAMEFLDGPNQFLLKDALMQGPVPLGAAASVGGLVGRIHATSAKPGFDRTAFANRADFDALRLDPYLRFTAARHPAAAGRIMQVLDGLYEAETVLVHGDVSPKNIIMRGSVPVILDAECATMGDASFDPAFCLNHLVLKALYRSDARRTLLEEAADFWDHYRDQIDWEDPAALASRVAILVPMLMLARVDGKSPVEYLTNAQTEHVRSVALDLIHRPPKTIAEFLDQITDQFERQHE
ncbi:phosphotransferase family protein [Flavimaricola marinus]|uniref:Methylthioribose kinase n=1 Tax=Flavimaricola marinus TaxID=1819565 RepID=A0A238LJ56_9RHOB|nr:phosphotransferase [Flavimaricola marinus]SMY09747.1 methylthioribose kinase [Flavimaricola marinus]